MVSDEGGATSNAMMDGVEGARLRIKTRPGTSAQRAKSTIGWRIKSKIDASGKKWAQARAAPSRGAGKRTS